MAKFSYRMQNILDIKYKMESQAKQNYVNARMRLEEKQSELENLFKQKKHLEMQYRKSASGSINVRTLADLKYAIDYQKEQIKNQYIEVKVAEKNFDIARARLNEVMKDRKIHEKLREKAFDGFLAEMNEQEKKEIDELTNFRYGLSQNN